MEDIPAEVRLRPKDRVSLVQCDRGSRRSPERPSNPGVGHPLRAGELL